MTELNAIKLSPEDRLSAELYSGLLLDAASLYEQRLNFLTDPSYHWTDFQPYETRLSNFLDALVNHNPRVEDFCREQAFEEDHGNLFTATYVLAKRTSFNGINSLINQIDFNNTQMKYAFADAVNLSLNQSDCLHLTNQLFTKGDIKHWEVAALIAGYHRLEVTDSLVQVLKQILQTENPTDHEPVIQTCLAALGKTLPLSAPVKQDFSFLDKLMTPDFSHQTQSQLAITLLKAKDPDIFRKCIEQFDQQTWPILPIGLFGESKASGALWQRIDSGTVDEGNLAIQAAGLLGSPDSINVFIQCLAFPDYVEAAAEALQLITGADLFEDIFIAEEIDPDDLFPDELERYNKGEPVYPPGEEPGETITRVIQDPETWQHWYNEHKDQFQPDQRYRYGQIISARSLLEALKAPKTPHAIRAFIVDELAIQFGIDVKIEKTMFVEDQMAAIEKAISQL